MLDQYLEPPDEAPEEGSGEYCWEPGGCRYRGCPECDPPDPYED